MGQSALTGYRGLRWFYRIGNPVGGGAPGEKILVEPRMLIDEPAEAEDFVGLAAGGLAEPVGGGAIVQEPHDGRGHAPARHLLEE